MLAMNDGRSLYHHYQPLSAQSPFYSPYSLKKEWQVRMHAMMDANSKGIVHSPSHSQHSPAPASGTSCGANANNIINNHSHNLAVSQSLGKHLPVENCNGCPCPNTFNHHHSQPLKETIGLLLYCSREYGVGVRSEELKKLVQLFISQVFDSVSSQSSGSCRNSTNSSNMSSSSSSPPQSSSPSSVLSSSAPLSSSSPSTTSSPIGSLDYALQGDILSCPVCYGVLLDPVTISCGHCYCKKCLKKEAIGQPCRRCKHVLSAGDVSNTKTNVLIGSLVEKWWPTEMKVTNLRNEGNALFEKKQLGQALIKYTEALNICKYKLIMIRFFFRLCSLHNFHRKDFL